jgi:hypothetical protein
VHHDRERLVGEDVGGAVGAQVYPAEANDRRAQRGTRSFFG